MRLFKVLIVAVIIYCISIYIETGFGLINVAAKIGLIICFPPILIVLNIIKDEEKRQIKKVCVNINNRIITMTKSVRAAKKI